MTRHPPVNPRGPRSLLPLFGLGWRDAHASGSRLSITPHAPRPSTNPHLFIPPTNIPSVIYHDVSESSRPRTGVLQHSLLFSRWSINILFFERPSFHREVQQWKREREIQEKGRAP
ncbi:unnamed protein product [Pylaiella littoralis]